MFKIGDVIIYGSQGICKIDSIQTKQIGRQDIDYYVLKPVFKEGSAVFVPIENTALTAKMQDVLTFAQAKELLDKIPQIDTLKHTNENNSREQYKIILASGNREDLVSLIKTIYAERDIRRQTGKRLNISDEQTLNKAETLLYNELAFVYGVEPDEAKNLINF